jgi:hypothetical protein
MVVLDVLLRLPYEVMRIKVDRAWRPLSKKLADYERKWAEAVWSYDGGRLGTTQLARALDIPDVLMLGYDLSS